MLIALSGVDFNVIAREWRMKWSTDNDKASLAQAQAALVSVLASVTNSLKKIIRIPCSLYLAIYLLARAPI